MTKSKMDIKEWLDQNHKLLSIVGIFGALTAYFSTLESIFLPFSTFAIFLFLCYEVWINFPRSEEASTRLKIFEYLFVFLFFSVLIYILVTYKQIIIGMSSIAFLGTYSYISIKLIERFKIDKLIRKQLKHNKKLNFLLRVIWALCIIVVVFILSFLSAILLRQIFE